jgi:hypothetical protein
MSKTVEKILMADSETRRILLGKSDPRKLERDILEALTIPNPPNIRLAMNIAGSSNDEDLVARTVLASATQLVAINYVECVDSAVDLVFETTWNHLMTFADMLNQDMPRRLFGGLVLGLLRMGDEINLAPYLAKIIMAPKFPPFMYVTGGKVETEIKQLVREWATLHKEHAGVILARIRREMTEGRMDKCPPPLSKMVAESMLYALIAHLPFVTKVGIGLIIDEIPGE